MAARNTKKILRNVSFSVVRVYLFLYSDDKYSENNGVYAIIINVLSENPHEVLKTSESIKIYPVPDLKELSS